MQIETVLIVGGAVRVDRGKCTHNGRKHYHAAIHFGLPGVKENARLLNKKHRKSTDAIEYGNRFVDRLRRSFSVIGEMNDAD